MITNKTYNNVIDTLKELGVQHDQIHTTTTGDIFDIDLNSNDTLFPLFHINPVNVSAGQSELVYNFQLFVMDAVGERENWTEANIQSAERLSKRFYQAVCRFVLTLLECLGIVNGRRQVN